MSESVVFDTNQWIEENKNEFSPPVCNKCMFDQQLKVFFVGGPNQRKDYHIEEGEEFFYQEKGDMCLKVMEKGAFKDIHIKEGQVFMLPAKIFHSPQRFQNTIGMVVERSRMQTEYDGLTYFVDGSSDILFQRWLHLKDVVKDLPPVIRAFFASEAHKTGKATSDSVLPEKERPFQSDRTRMLPEPFSLAKWIQNHAEKIRANGNSVLFGQPDYKTTVKIHGVGNHCIQSEGGEILLKQLKGSSVLQAEKGKEIIKEGSTARVQASSATLSTEADSLCLSLQMPPPKIH